MTAAAFNRLDASRTSSGATARQRGVIAKLRAPQSGLALDLAEVGKTFGATRVARRLAADPTRRVRRHCRP
jgi:hypothetical protein